MGFAVEFDHVQEVGKSGRLRYRRRIPPPLRRFIPGEPHEFTRSLGATTLKNNLAAQKRLAEAAAEYDAVIAQALALKACDERASRQAFDTLTSDTVEAIVAYWQGDEWAAIKAHHWQRKDPERRASYRAHTLADIEDWHKENTALRANGDIDAVVAAFEGLADDLLFSCGLLVDRGSDDFTKLCLRILDAQTDLTAKQLSLIEGRAVADFPPAPSILKVSPAPKQAELTFDTIAEALLGNERHDIGASTKQAARTALRSFRDAHGDLKPHEITKGLVSDWLDLLAKKPRTLPASERTLSLRTIVERYSGKPDVPKLSAKTIAVQLGALSALWNKAQSEEGRIADDLKNPFGGRASIAKAIKRPEEPQELSGDELRAIFALSIFTRGERPKRGKGHAAYWLPLMLLWTGARPEELAQLIVSDITKDAQTGRWMLRITDEGEHPHKGSRRLKTTDKQTGRRTFPVPQALIDLNFIQYVDSIRDAGDVALFPLLRTKGERKLLFAGWGEWWNGYVQQAGILPAGANRRASREFRHNWTTAARASGIARDAREYIQGHRPTDASANEGYGAKSPLGFQIDQLGFAQLDLHDVTPWQP